MLVSSTVPESDEVVRVPSPPRPDSPILPTMWIPNLVLYKEDKSILDSATEWLTDSIIYAGQLLLRKKVSGKVFGLQSTQHCRKIGSFAEIPQGCAFIQILLVSNSHWITVSNIDTRSHHEDNFLPTCNTIDLYDSLRPRTIDCSIMDMVCSFYKCPSDFINFDITNIEGQDDSHSCGLYALACATELAYGGDPCLCKWDKEKMRKHLIFCFENGMVSLYN